jgi:hypothetical protein
VPGALGLVLLVLALVPDSPAGGQLPAATDPSGAARARLVSLLNDVGGAKRAVYDTRDTAGLPVETIKIVQLGKKSYLGVYHVNIGRQFSVRVARSADLVHWTFIRTLASDASQPTIAALPGGAFLVGIEKEQRRLLPVRLSHVEFLYYPSLQALFTAAPTQHFRVPNTLSALHEGTPSISTVSVGTPSTGILGLFAAPPLSTSSIDIGFHYYDPVLGIDRNATGRVSGFLRYTSLDATTLNNLLFPLVHGNIGDRDRVVFDGYPFTLIEAEATPRQFASFRVFLWDETAGTITPLAPRTAHGSRAFGNPKATVVTDPAGHRALAISMYLFSEAAGAGETGPLVYYSEF